ncbi:MarC family protein [Haloferula sp.]|uniref:MarC family protein n=1 Tax=Haloferula sp. TaxID=2497595 RepID=UPI003C722CDA
MNDLPQAIATMLPLINPGICAAMFMQATSGKALKDKLADATRASLAILVILSIAALIGTRLLDAFGISLDAFMVAGGGVLAWMGFSMLSSKPSSGNSGSANSLTPLILFAASPGTITGVITLSAAHTRLDFPLTALIAIAVATTATWLLMLLIARFGKAKSGGGFLRDTLTRFMGLIVLAMGVQFALTGLHAFGKESPSVPANPSSSLSQPQGGPETKP